MPPLASKLFGGALDQLFPAPGGVMLRKALGVRGIVAAGEGRSSSDSTVSWRSLERTGVGADMPIKVALFELRLDRTGAVETVSGAGACDAVSVGVLAVAGAAAGLELAGRGGLDELAGRGGALAVRACGGELDALADCTGLDGGGLDALAARGGLLGGRGGALLAGRGGTLLVRDGLASAALLRTPLAAGADGGGALVRATGSALVGAAGAAAGTGGAATELMPEFAGFAAGSSSAVPQPSSSSSAW